MRLIHVLLVLALLHVCFANVCTDGGGTCTEQSACAAPKVWVGGRGCPGSPAHPPNLKCCMDLPPPDISNDPPEACGLRFPIRAGQTSTLSPSFGTPRLAGCGDSSKPNSPRCTRCHSGCDIMTSRNVQGGHGQMGTVQAMTRGTVVNIFDFLKCTGSAQKAKAVLIQHGNHVFNYGEINADSIPPHIYVGATVVAGQRIGDTTHCGMLHFEIYNQGQTNNIQWPVPSGETLLAGQNCFYGRHWRLPAGVINCDDFLRDMFGSQTHCANWPGIVDNSAATTTATPTQAASTGGASSSESAPSTSASATTTASAPDTTVAPTTSDTAAPAPSEEEGEAPSTTTGDSSATAVNGSPPPAPAPSASGSPPPAPPPPPPAPAPTTDGATGSPASKDSTPAPTTDGASASTKETATNTAPTDTASGSAPTKDSVPASKDATPVPATTAEGSAAKNDTAPAPPTTDGADKGSTTKDSSASDPVPTDGGKDVAPAPVDGGKGTAPAPDSGATSKDVPADNPKSAEDAGSKVSLLQKLARKHQQPSLLVDQTRAHLRGH